MDVAGVTGEVLDRGQDFPARIGRGELLHVVVNHRAHLEQEMAAGEQPIGRFGDQTLDERRPVGAAVQGEVRLMLAHFFGQFAHLGIEGLETGAGVLNPLRFDDEFVRHKMLDVVGDLALVGHQIIGHVSVQRGGHALHAELAAELLKNTESWMLVDAPELVGLRVPATAS